MTHDGICNLTFSMYNYLNNNMKPYLVNNQLSEFTRFRFYSRPHRIYFEFDSNRLLVYIILHFGKCFTLLFHLYIYLYNKKLTLVFLFRSHCFSFDLSLSHLIIKNPVYSNTHAARTQTHTITKKNSTYTLIKRERER